MKVTLQAGPRRRTPGALAYRTLYVTFRGEGARELVITNARKLIRVVRERLALRPPDERELSVRCEAEVWGPRGGRRRVLLARWQPGEPLDEFARTVRTRLAAIPTGDVDRIEKREGWIDDEELP